MLLTPDPSAPSDSLGAGSPEQRVLIALLDAGLSFTNTWRLVDVLDRLLNAALVVAEADEGSVMLLTPDRQSLEVAAARGPRAASIVGQSQPIDRSVAGWVLREQRPLLVHGALGPGAPAGVESDHPRELSSSIVVRLENAGQVLGVMSVNRAPRAPRMDERSQLLMEVLARQAAIVIHNAQLMEALQRKEERLEQLVDQLLRESGRVARPRMPLEQPLTDREQAVLELLVEGLTNREIAVKLCVEPDTVKDYVQRVVKKLHAVDRTHAAAIAVRGGLVQ